MARFICNNCLGEYRSPGSDGIEYFHACPEGRVFQDGTFTPYSPQNRRDENVSGLGVIKGEGRGRRNAALVHFASKMIGD